MNNDFIDADEGYRDTDWDSSLREPKAFYTNSQPCESCGKPVDCDRYPASYDPELLVGPCCQVEEVEGPDDPICPGLYQAVMSSNSVSEIMRQVESHKLICALCNHLLRKAA